MNAWKISEIIAVTGVSTHIIYQKQLAWIWQGYKWTIMLSEANKKQKFDGLVKNMIMNKKLKVTASTED